MMQPKQLQGFGLDSRPKEERIALAKKAGRKGGLSKSPKKSLAQRIRLARLYTDEELKSKTLTKAILMLENPEYAELDLIEYAQQIKVEANKTKDVELKARIARLNVDTFKAVHGERIKQMNLNITSSQDVADSVVDKLFGSMKSEEDKEEDDGER